MRAIRRKAFLLALAATLCVVASIWACSLPAVVLVPHAALSLPAFIAAATLMALSLREYERLRAARLIVENQILHILPATVAAGDCRSAPAAIAAASEITVSCFGILLDSRIIKFNQDGILLQAVEIGPDFISLTYGMGGRVQHTRLLHGAIDAVEVARIVERFRFETGVTPVVID